MTYSKFDPKVYEVACKLANVGASSFWSTLDQCRVTLLNCKSCGRIYTETLTAARLCIFIDRPPCCLRCQKGPEVDKPAISAITLRF